MLILFWTKASGVSRWEGQAKIRSRVWLKLWQTHDLEPEVGRCKVGSAQRNTRRLPPPENQPCVWVEPHGTRKLVALSQLNTASSCTGKIFLVLLK
ncbi:hypothetical protein E2C01_055631 [Portunus trituberculatus]|uniref:Uncharacterized protein n=1 Tax=Portunus trituberculatus TaxID=210409 RepID=A0A5B7GXE8_PORTR|nr:hypothetical protein [Portunus trituberculatus]